MGSLIVKKVIYAGENYVYSSPELTTGINIILGDNGSGKSTFSYFIEYGFGGKVKPFMNDDVDARYSLILNDTNNYVQLDILIDRVPYSLKRFINSQDIFIEHGGHVDTYALDRRSADYIFSDWLLDKLGIPVFELYLGATHWYFNFNDLFRLLNYDQNTETRKIYKEPIAENFVADSVVIRKSIFEILLGISSVEFFKKQDEARAAMKARDLAKGLFENFKDNHEISDDYEKLNSRKIEASKNLAELEEKRNSELKQNTTVDDKVGELADVQAKLIDLQLNASQDRVMLANISNEQHKVSVLHQGLVEEIAQIEKIIFTHDKLDLFAMEVCPFCMARKNVQQGFCICGSPFNDDDYEKFVYNSNEYKDILTRKQKGIEAITVADLAYRSDVKKISERLNATNDKFEEYTLKLRNIINTAEYAGNNTVIDDLNDRIFKVKEELLQINFGMRNSEQYARLQADFIEKNRVFGIAQGNLNRAMEAHEKNNADTISAFNKVYSALLAKSSYKSKEAYIDDSYMPFIDNREYKANSSEVPKRLMYYFTILSLALKMNSVKHPRFLLIDTPEDSGIDTDHLNLNLLLLEDAIALGADKDGNIRDFQVILTTGYGKFPQEFEKYILERFSAKDGNFILKPSVRLYIAVDKDGSDPLDL